MLSHLPGQVCPPYDLETMAYSEWFLRLEKNGLDEESLLFSIKGRGLDTNQISPSLGRCLIQPMPNRSMTDDEEDVGCPVNRMTTDHDTPVLWTIHHNPSITFSLLQSLEHSIPDLYFFCHCNGNEIPLSEEEEHGWSIIDSLCEHPFNNEEGDNRSSYRRGMIGLDISCMTNNLYPDGYAKVPPNWSESLCSFPQRYQAFSGDVSDIVVEYIYEINTKKQRLVLSNDLDDDDKDIPRACDDDDLDQYRNISDAAVKSFDEMYVNAPVKIVDLGNACWVHRHFTDDIQTRQYRSPEVIIGAKYSTCADMWSLACIIFELLTGDLLFDPHAGKSWDRDEDHLAMMIELIGNFPKKVTSQGKRSQQYFNKHGELRNIHHLKFWPLQSVLQEKYLFDEQDALEVASFLEPLLEVRNSITFFSSHFNFRLILTKERLQKNVYNIHGSIWSRTHLHDLAYPFQDKKREARIKEVMTVTLNTKEMTEILLMRNSQVMMMILMMRMIMTATHTMTKSTIVNQNGHLQGNKVLNWFEWV
jgi:serine/threonine protein kinase